jgi:hypothetical protein
LGGLVAALLLSAIRDSVQTLDGAAPFGTAVHTGHSRTGRKRTSARRGDVLAATRRRVSATPSPRARSECLARARGRAAHPGDKRALRSRGNVRPQRQLLVNRPDSDPAVYPVEAVLLQELGVTLR